MTPVTAVAGHEHGRAIRTPLFLRFAFGSWNAANPYLLAMRTTTKGSFRGDGRHASNMERAIDIARRGEPTEQQRQEFTVTLVETFNEAQSAWDAYRDHLIEHGLLTRTDGPIDPQSLR